MTEAELQAALVRWADHQPFRCGDCKGRIGDYLLHVANGGLRPFRVNQRTGQRYSVESQKLRKMGVRPGVPDLFLAVPCDGSAGLWLELKRPGAISRISADQLAWIQKLEAAGYQVDVCDTLDSAIEAIKAYLGIGDGDGVRQVA